MLSNRAWQHHYWSLWAIFFVLACVIYAPVAEFTLFQDDYVWISHAKDIAAHNAGLFSTRISNFFMPVIYGYFFLAYSAFGVHAVLYYLVNIALHAVNALLVYRWTGLFLNPSIALLISTLFLTLRYPLEAVSWISAITVLVVMCFFLLTTYLWTLYLRTAKSSYYYAVLFFTIVLLCTKEWSVLLIPLLGLSSVLVICQRSLVVPHHRLMTRSLPLVGLFIIYLLCQSLLQGDAAGLVQQGHYQLGWHAVPNILNNILLTALPVTNVAHTQPQVWLMASIFSFCMAASIGVFLWRKHNNPALLGLLWMVVSFVPTSFFTWDPYVSRYAYIPALGMVLAIGFVLQYMHQSHVYRRFLPVATILLLLYCAMNAIFTRRVLTQLYLPIHTEITAFSQSLADALPRLDTTGAVYIVDNTPHKGFILPEVLHTLAGISPQMVQVIHVAADCPAAAQCLVWDGEKL